MKLICFEHYEDAMRLFIVFALLVTAVISACVPSRYYDPTLFDPKSSSLSQGKRSVANGKLA